MALADDILKGNVLTGIGIGLGVILLAPVAGKVLRPLAKELIKGGMLAYQGLGEFGETVGDIVAEAESELQHDGDAEPPIPPTSKRRK